MEHGTLLHKRLINIHLEPRNQTSQAGIGLHFIAIAISESRRKKSYNKNQKLYLLVNLILKSYLLVRKVFKNAKIPKIENQKLKIEN